MTVGGGGVWAYPWHPPLSGLCPQQPSKNKTRNEPIWDCDVFAATFSSQQVPYYFGSYIYIVRAFINLLTL